MDTEEYAYILNICGPLVSGDPDIHGGKFLTLFDIFLSLSHYNSSSNNVHIKVFI